MSMIQAHAHRCDNDPVKMAAWTRKKDRAEKVVQRERETRGKQREREREMESHLGSIMIQQEADSAWRRKKQGADSETIQKHEQRRSPVQMTVDISPDHIFSNNC